VEFRLGPALGPHPLLERLVLERIEQLESADTLRPDASFSDGEVRQAGSTLETPPESARGFNPH
jgi:hypothetical protein